MFDLIRVYYVHNTYLNYTCWKSKFFLILFYLSSKYKLNSGRRRLNVK